MPRRACRAKMLADIARQAAWSCASRERARASGADRGRRSPPTTRSIADAVAALRLRGRDDRGRPRDRHRPHRRGRRRCARWPPDDIVVNVQGDEPLIDPALIRKVAARARARTADAAIATAAIRSHSAAAFFDPNVVKVVLDADGYALYFSRAPIPYARDAFAHARIDAARRPARLPPSSASTPIACAFLREYARLAPAPPSASRRWSSCARWGTATASRSPSGTRRSRPAWTPRRTCERVRRELASA